MHTQFLKNVLHLGKSTPNCMVYGETGENSLSYTIGSRMLCYWCKLVTGNHRTLSSVMCRLWSIMHGKQAFESNRIFT